MKESTRWTAQRRAGAALLASGAFLAASTVPAAAAQSSQSACVSYNSSTTAGNLSDISFAVPTYFGCADDGFLVAVDSTSYTSIDPLDALSWTCTGGEVIGSISSETTAEDSVSFTVGITHVQTSIEEDAVPFLGDMYIGGYDIDYDGAGVWFSWKGPLGDFDDDDIVLPGIWYTSCGSDAFATGVTVWSSTKYVYGVILECANVTETCAPPNYPAILIEGTMSGTDLTPPPSSTVAPTDTPSSLSANTVAPSGTPRTSSGVATDAPNFSDDTVSAIDTPSPSMTSTSSGNDSAEALPAGDASTSSTSTTAVVGGSVAGGLFVLAVCIGAACCFYRRKDRNTRHPDKPRDAFGTPTPMARRDRGGGGRTVNEGEAVTRVVGASSGPLAAAAPDSRGPPPPYIEP